MKQCGKCSEEKPLTEYYHQKGKPKSHCKVCEKQYGKKYFKTDRGKQVSAKWVYKHQGVYGIFSDMTCLYVGESSRVDKRISEHKSNIKNIVTNTQKELYYNLQKHDNIEFRILEETQQHKTQERIWIEYLCPLYNTI